MLVERISTFKFKKFINPYLYGIPENNKKIFHDIIIGNNGKYQCNKGYDLVTGFGSINFKRLKKYLKNQK